MAIVRDEQGRLVVDGKVVPQYLEQLYLRRGVGAVGDKAEFPAKAEADKVQAMERPYDAHVTMAGGEVRRNDELQRELPDHPETRVPEKLERVDVTVNTGGASAGGDAGAGGITQAECPKVDGPTD